MTIEERAAELFDFLRDLGFRSLVMGGHAVRHYGLDRRTSDFDFQLAVQPDGWPEFAGRLAASGRFAVFTQGDSWRPEDFRRFVIGTLPDGREERLELWRSNHLLPAFEDAWSRREQAAYGGREVAFLGLDDLIRSKETEREDDWSDVRILEEVADERRLAQATNVAHAAEVLARLRSRRGFESAIARGFFQDAVAVAEAASRATHPVTRAYLAPYLTLARAPDEILERALASVPPGSAKHLALVEAVRNRYRMAAAALDRADKERVRRKQA